MDWAVFMEQAGNWAEAHFNEIMLYGFGGLGLAFVIVIVFKGVNRRWKLPFLRYKPKKR